VDTAEETLVPGREFSSSAPDSRLQHQLEVRAVVGAVTVVGAVIVVIPTAVSGAGPGSLRLQQTISAPSMP
jgi:hypothetical protein